MPGVEPPSCAGHTPPECCRGAERETEAQRGRHFILGLKVPTVCQAFKPSHGRKHYSVFTLRCEQLSEFRGRARCGGTGL